MVWLVVQAFLDALFPTLILIIDIGFSLYAIYGLLEGFDEILGASTAKAFILAVVNLAVNVWLMSVIH